MWLDLRSASDPASSWALQMMRSEPETEPATQDPHEMGFHVSASSTISRCKGCHGIARLGPVTRDLPLLQSIPYNLHQLLGLWGHLPQQPC